MFAIIVHTNVNYASYFRVQLWVTSQGGVVLVSCPDYFSPRGKIVWWTAYIVLVPIFWNHCDVTQLDCVFKNALVNSKLWDSLLVLLSRDRKA